MFLYQSFPQYIPYATNGKKPHLKSKFTPEEDEKLKSIVKEIGENDWIAVSNKMGTRNTRQCKERWFNYLSPNVKILPWTPEEDEQLKDLYKEYGAKWVKISQFFPSRTDTNIKSRWMVLQRLQKRLEKKSLKNVGRNGNSYRTSKANNDGNKSSIELETTKLPESHEINSTKNLIPLSDNEPPNIFDDAMELSPMDSFNEECFDFFEMI